MVHLVLLVLSFHPLLKSFLSRFVSQMNNYSTFTFKRHYGQNKQVFSDFERLFLSRPSASVRFLPPTPPDCISSAVQNRPVLFFGIQSSVCMVIFHT
jgi:hypothetical protein